MRHAAQTAAPHPARPGLEAHHTCLECPVCGTEECRVLADLGRYCDTAQAAHESRAAQVARSRTRPPRSPSRQR